MEFIRRANQDTTICFPLISTNTGNYDAAITLTPGDVKYAIHSSAGWQAFAAVTNLPVSLGLGYFAWDALAVELNPDNKRYPIVVTVIDQSVTKEWRDDSFLVRFDVGSTPRARTIGAFTTTAGTEFRVLVWAEQDGSTITLTSAATCTMTVYEHGSDIVVFTLNGSSPNARSLFELTQSNPNFTADRVYYAIITVTDGNQIYQGIDVFPIFG